MNEHPILFSTEMVKAILDGRKTMTRRVMKYAFDGSDWAGNVHLDGAGEGYIAWWPDGTAEMTRDCYPNGGGFRCPYGKPGDLLWVREAWKLSPRGNALYRADPAFGPDSYEKGWRPSIHMPRWASRINLEVTGVRVERVQDISEDDAIAEGMEIVPIGTSTWSNRQSFSILWNTINAKRGYSWDSNPWVWVVEFKRVNP